jgi:hypothetical protein
VIEEDGKTQKEDGGKMLGHSNEWKHVEGGSHEQF